MLEIRNMLRLEDLAQIQGLGVTIENDYVEWVDSRGGRLRTEKSVSREYFHRVTAWGM